MHLGILDWGIGGFDFYRKLRPCYPELQVTYLSDSGCVPYGKLPALHLRDRVQAALTWLQAQGVERVVVACNAASTALPALARSGACPAAVGVIEPSLETLMRLRPANVAVLGGERTIRSGAYSRPLRQAGIAVQAVVAQPLSALVEAGTLSGPELEHALARICKRLSKVDVLVPACTHYTALLPRLQELLQPRLVVDPATETLRTLQDLAVAGSPAAGDPSLRCFTTGDPVQTRRAAAAAFGLELGEVATVVVPCTRRYPGGRCMTAMS